MHTFDYLGMAAAAFWRDYWGIIILILLLALVIGFLIIRAKIRLSFYRKVNYGRKYKNSRPYYRRRWR